jgi:hypothetical protein
MQVAKRPWFSRQSRLLLEARLRRACRLSCAWLSRQSRLLLECLEQLIDMSPLTLRCALLAVLGVSVIPSCSAAAPSDPAHGGRSHLAAGRGRQWMLNIKDWALGEDLRGPSSGRPEVGLLVMSVSGENPRPLTDCSMAIQDSLPTGARSGEHFFILDGQLYIGMAQPGAVPARVAVTPGHLVFSRLLDVSRAGSPTTLLASVVQSDAEELWEFQIEARRAHGKPVSWNDQYRDFHTYRRMFEVARCDPDGRNCLVTFWEQGKVIVDAEVEGPLAPRTPLFELQDCQRVVRAWWSREDAAVYLLASCKEMCPKTRP